MVASEVHPFAKTGGLADVLGALPLALVKLGHQVDVVMPRYRGVQRGLSNRPDHRSRSEGKSMSSTSPP